MILATQTSSAGSCSTLAKETDEDIIVRHHNVSFHPDRGMDDVRRISRQQEQDNSETLVEVSMHGHRSEFKQTWQRVEEQHVYDDAVTLELLDDPQGRVGFWVVIGTWFG